MTAEIALTPTILLVAVVLFATEKLRFDLTPPTRDFAKMLWIFIDRWSRKIKPADTAGF